MERSTLYILLIFTVLLIITGVVVYFLLQNQDKVIYINQHENNTGNQSSRLLLKNHHLNKTMILEGGKYNIYLEDNLKNKNGVITIVHLDDSMDKISIIYPSNIYIVEYSSSTTPYETGEHHINGKIHLHPNSTGFGSVNWHTTVIRISPEMTNVNINCMILDADTFSTFT